MSVDAVARAVLYEGWSLYPYRPSALKNARRVLLGTIEAPGEAQVECLLRHGGESASELGSLRATLRFLRPEDGIETSIEVLTDGARARGRTDFGGGSAELDAATLRPGLVRVRARVVATTRELGAAHFVLRATGATAATGASAAAPTTWLSQIDPPADVACESAACVNVGLYPVLVGDAVLASPIILYDQPAIAPESGGDLFDATEIEEILALRVMTLSDAEKAEIRANGGASAGILARVGAMTSADLLRVHGARRDLQRGDRVRLRPRQVRRADALDVVLSGLEATVIAIDDTIEGERLYSVTIDRDPGSDLGEQGFPGHRFFFRADEIERLP